MTQVEIDGLVERWMDIELAEAEDWRALNGPISDECRDGMTDLIADKRQEVEWALLGSDYQIIEKEADEVLKAAGLPLLDHGSVDFKRLCRRLLVGKQEVLRIDQARWGGNYTERLPSRSTVAQAPAPVVLTPTVKASPLFSIVATKYLVERPRARNGAELVQIEFGKFMKVIGGDRPIASITKTDGRAYKDSLIQGRKLTLATVSKHLNTLSGVFTWAERQGYTPEGSNNPIKGLAPSRAEGASQKQDILPFTDGQLLQVFDSPYFLKQRVQWPERWWITLICLFQLCRREEAAQLAVADIGEIEGIPCIFITDLGEGQSLKTPGSKRKMPIHSSLIALGFLDYVQTVRKQKHTRLFYQLPMGRNGYSDAVGKWFARLLDQVGLPQPELVMHSLRHGIHYLHALGCPTDVAEMLTGHTASSVHNQYEHRELTKISRLRDGLEKMQFPEVVKALSAKGKTE